MGFGMGRMGLGMGRMGSVTTGRAFSISDLFANGTYAGFDFTDLERTKVWGPSSLPLLYNLRTAPITASAQTVFNAVDKSQGVTVGAELLADPGFDNAGSWTVGANWSVSGSKATHTPGSTQTVGQSIASLAPLAMFLVTFTISGRTAGSLSARIVGVANHDAAGYATNDTFTAYIESDASGSIFRFVPTSDFDGAVEVASVRKISGNPGTQSTSGSRPAYTESGALRYLLGDGVDDGLLTSFVPGSIVTIAVACRIGSVSKAISGSNDAATTGRAALLGLNPSGFAVASLGTGSLSTSTIVGSVDRRAADLIMAMRYDIAGNAVELWEAVNGGTFTRVSTGTIAGTPNTSVALSILASNGNGTMAGFIDGRWYAGYAVNRWVSDGLFKWTAKNVLAPSAGITIST